MKGESDLSMANKHRKYMEDDFDLDHYIKERADKSAKEKNDEQGRRILSIIKFLIIIAAFITAYEIYAYASHLIEVWRDNRINETARDIIGQAGAAEPPSLRKQPALREPAALRELPSLQEQPALREQSSVQDWRGAVSTRGAYIQSITPVPELMPAILDLRHLFHNNDIVAYLKIEDSNIGFPVVQTGDNAYYLTHDLHLQENAAGSAFMDCENQLYPLGYNTVIYAHNMRDGSMFHDLRNYSDQDYFDAHKTISLQTLNENTLWEIFSFYETDIEFLYNTTTFYSIDDFFTFANLLKEKSKYKTDVSFTEDSKILTLSTCTNRGSDTRFVVHAYCVNHQT